MWISIIQRRIREAAFVRGNPAHVLPTSANNYARAVESGGSRRFRIHIKGMAANNTRIEKPHVQAAAKKLTEKELSESGYFKPTAIVKEAWETTRACAKALKARTVLFQCPASFKSSDENIENLYKFFSEIDRGKLNFCWEPRGPWSDDVIKAICTDLKLWHVVDPFAKGTVTPDKCYFRLHGRTGWRYQYEDGELEELVSLLPNKIAYVFFNNIEMTNDAMRFRHIYEGSGQS